MKSDTRPLKLIFTRKILFSVCFMLFFWALFDALISIMTPIAIKNAGFSNTSLGLIIGFSSLAGAIFDFLLSKYLTRTHFRRIFLLMFLCCFAYPLVLTGAKSLWLFLIAMVIWGLYYDLNNFGSLDFVGRKFGEHTNAVSFFLMDFSTNMGYMLFSLVFAAGIVLTATPQTLLFLYLMLFLSFSGYLSLLYFNRKEKKDFIPDRRLHSFSFFVEAKLWLRINKIIFPLVILTLLFNIFDGFFWTLGPLLLASTPDIQTITSKLTQMQTDTVSTASVTSLTEFISTWFPVSDAMLLVYTVLIISIVIILFFFRSGLGKIRTAYIIFFFGALAMVLLIFLKNPLELFFPILFVIACSGFAMPLLDSAYADYVKNSYSVEKEIQGIQDFFVNVGYVIGPVLSGILADRFGYIRSFSFLGGFFMVVILAVLFFTPKNTTTASLKSLHKA